MQFYKGATMAQWLLHWSLDQALQVQTLPAEDIKICLVLLKNSILQPQTGLMNPPHTIQCLEYTRTNSESILSS